MHEMIAIQFWNEMCFCFFVKFVGKRYLRVFIFRKRGAENNATSDCNKSYVRNTFVSILSSARCEHIAQILVPCSNACIAALHNNPWMHGATDPAKRVAPTAKDRGEACRYDRLASEYPRSDFVRTWNT